MRSAVKPVWFPGNIFMVFVVGIAVESQNRGQDKRLKLPHQVGLMPLLRDEKNMRGHQGKTGQEFLSRACIKI